MGCDIHLHTEVKIDGIWHTYGTHTAHLMSVETTMYLPKWLMYVTPYGEIKPISEPRGMPDDCSVVTRVKAKYWEADAHSHSWLGAEEIRELEEWYEETFKHLKIPYSWASHMFGYSFGDSWGSFTKYPEDNPEGIEDIRFVFWFDC